MIQRPALNLYHDDRRRYPMEDIIEKMRNRDIRISPQADGTISVSFAYPDPTKAEGTTRVLMNQLATATDTVSGYNARVWKAAWPNDPLPPRQRLTLVSEPQLPSGRSGPREPHFCRSERASDFWRRG